MSNEIIISTDQVEPRNRTDMWRELSDTMYSVVSWDHIDSNAGIEGTLEARPIGDMVLKKMKSIGQEVRRDRAHIQRYSYDYYYLSFLLKGSTKGDFDGTHVQANACDIVINDVTRPSHRYLTKFSSYGVTIPRAILEHLIGGRSLHGLVLPADAPTTRLIRDYMQGLYSIAPRPSSISKTHAVQEALAGLVANSVTGLLPQQTPEQHHAINMALHNRMLHFIDQHLSDPSLSPEALQKRFNISRAHLYRMFEEEGGVATVIRQRRLEHAWHKLANTAPGVRSTKQLAHEMGFTSSSQFIRAFRTHYGITPQTVWHEKPVSGYIEMLRKYKTAPRALTVKTHKETP